MDYEWMEFIKSIRNQSGNQKGLSLDGNVITEGQAAGMKKALSAAFSEYRNMSVSRKEALELLLRLHTDLCRERAGDELLKRRHNVLVYRYVVDTIASTKVIASKLNISKETLYLDINRILDELMVLCLGIPYLLSGKEREEIAGEVLENYCLLRRCKDARGVVSAFPELMQGEVLRYRKAGAALLRQFQQCITLYFRFCAEIYQPGEQRRKEILTSGYLQGSRTVMELVAECGCSKETIYNDILIIRKRLTDLLLP